MMRHPFFIFGLLPFIFFVCSSNVLGAQSLVVDRAGPGLQMQPLHLSTYFPKLTTSLLFVSEPRLHAKPEFNMRTRPTPKTYSYERLSLFCKWEVRMEQKARFPVKVRLGDVQTVDRLEGKY